MKFAKAHAYGNDFLYIRSRDVAAGVALDALARELCERHTGIGADGLILYEPTIDGAMIVANRVRRLARLAAEAASSSPSKSG